MIRYFHIDLKLFA